MCDYLLEYVPFRFWLVFDGRKTLLNMFQLGSALSERRHDKRLIHQTQQTRRSEP